MRISRIVIRNFKTFHSLDVPINAGVTCIIGENNTGKTNLFHAIRLVLDVNLPSYFRQLSENDVHRCAGLNDAQQVLLTSDCERYYYITRTV
jgi:putative ATP-dependent endonuclease of OLD family